MKKVFTLIAAASMATSAFAALGELNREEREISGGGYTVRNVTLAKDFRMELMYVVPRETQGAWTPATFDSKGRMIVGDDGADRMFRLTFPAVGSSEPTKVEPINLGIGGLNGVLYAYDSLYVAVNAGSKTHGVYRITDKNKDDQWDTVEVIRNLNGNDDHGVHALEQGPDGRIYIINGNNTGISVFQSSRVPYAWSEDNLVRRVATGFQETQLAPQGWIASFPEDGKNWELYSIGMRNPVDFGFNKDGELFQYDADMEWDKGAPWYRPTYVGHVISGSDFHFHNGARKQPLYYPDVWRHVAPIGSGSPTGATFGVGAKFPAKYQDSMYLADWSYGNIYSVHVKPQGSTYTGVPELFLSGQPFPAADVVINKLDGAMYIVVGGRNNSAVFRVTYTGSESTARSMPDTTFAAARKQRKDLEAFHGKKDNRAIAAAWPHLGSADEGIRWAARTAIEWQDVAGWRDRALAEKNPRALTSAMIALARVSGKDEFFRTPADPMPDQQLKVRMVQALNQINFDDLAYQEKLDLLRAYGLIFIRMGDPDAATAQQLIAKFDPHLPADNRELNRELAEMLIFLKAPSAAAKVVDLLKTSPTLPYLATPSQFLNPILAPRRDGRGGGAGGMAYQAGGRLSGNENVRLAKQEDEIHYVQLLRNLDVGWTTALRQEFLELAYTTAVNFVGANQARGYYTTVRNEAIAAIPEADRADPVIAEIIARPAPAAAAGGRGGGGGGGAAGGGGGGAGAGGAAPAPAGGGRGGAAAPAPAGQL